MRTVCLDVDNTVYEKRPSATALGFFDGMHTGHRDIVRGMVESARRKGLDATVFTFPSEERGLKKGAPRLYSTEEKLRIFEDLGVDTVFLVPFESVRNISPEDFVEKVLVGVMDCKEAHCGYNFRFGRMGAGNAELLTSVMARLGGAAVIYEERLYGTHTLSSSEIKLALSEGRVEDATNMLSRPYFVSGRVERGLGLGRTWGIPTVNLPLSKDSPLRSGVYLTCVSDGEDRYIGITNVGVCPTIMPRDRHLETFILNFEGNLYDRQIKIHFLSYIRDEEKFSSSDELAERIKRDEIIALHKAEEMKWQEIGLN